MKQQKVLIVASIVGFIETFNKDLIEYLNNANQKVYISTTSILHDHLSVARTMIAIKN